MVWNNVVGKFSAAGKGVAWAVKTDTSFRIHLPAAAMVIAAGWWLHISAIEICVIILAAAQVVALEIINTAIEAYVRVSHPQRDPRIGHVLDAAAGAVLVATIAAVIVGLIILGPPMIEVFAPSKTPLPIR